VNLNIRSKNDLGTLKGIRGLLYINGKDATDQLKGL
jgi:hypothetical protein